jgi:hypothetical protein
MKQEIHELQQKYQYLQIETLQITKEVPKAVEEKSKGAAKNSQNALFFPVFVIVI